MSRAAALATYGNAVHVQITRGKSKGVQQFQQEIIKIGRAPNNDIAFTTDQKVSREHAEIHLVNDQAIIRNLSQSSHLLVNGVAVSEAALGPGSVVQLGDSEFIFEPGQVPSQTQPRIEGLASQSQPAPAGNRLVFYMVALLLVGGLLLLAQGGKNRQQDDDLRTSDDIAEDIVKSENVLKELQKKQLETGQLTPQYKMAQEHYIKGFRDYRNGQYARAMQSFQAALSFHPQHELARKYLTISRRKFDELVQFNMIQGRKYLAKSNHRMCASAFMKVLVMLKDENDPIFKEAKQYFEECQFHLQGRF